MENLTDKKEIYQSILNRIVSTDTSREWITKPFNALGKTMATNSYTIVVVPLCGDYVNYEERIKNIYPLPKNMDSVILLQDLKDKLALLPLVDCYDEVEGKCSACKGEGEVEYTFKHNCQTYDLDYECPVCEGEGTEMIKSSTPNGKKEIDANCFVKIGECIFNTDRISELLFIADALKSDIKVITQTQPHKPTVFLISDVEVMLMSSIGIEDSQISLTIPL